MVTGIALSPAGVVAVPKPIASSKMPTSTTVKLDKGLFADLWWVARVEKKSPGDLLRELAGVQITARRKMHEPTIAKLVKHDAAEDQIVSQAKTE